MQLKLKFFLCLDMDSKYDPVPTHETSNGLPAVQVVDASDEEDFDSESGGGDIGDTTPSRQGSRSNSIFTIGSTAIEKVPQIVRSSSKKVSSEKIAFIFPIHATIFASGQE